MNWIAGRRLLIACSIAILACGNDDSSPTGQQDPDVVALPNLVASNAMAIPAGAGLGVAGTGEVTWISLPPGTVSGSPTLRIRNSTRGGEPTDPIPVVDGGFDPVAVLAGEGDELVLEFMWANGDVEVSRVRVPPRRPPAVVRTSPPRGRTDIALYVRPAVIFSEPIDPGTLTPESVRLTTAGTPVSGSIRRDAQKPWLVELAPVAPLRPATEYVLEIGTGVRDLQGDALEAPLSVTFTTVDAPDPRLAFVRLEGGANTIYLANADGSHVTRLTEGYHPAWSPDGRRIAFTRNRPGTNDPEYREVWVIDVDGTGEARLTAGGSPDWSPDGTKLLFTRQWVINPVETGELFVMNADGSGVTLIRPHSTGSEDGSSYCVHQAPTGDLDMYTTGVAAARWSPDGQRIAFTASVPAWEGVGVCIMNADGSGARRLTEDQLIGAAIPAWSPDGSTIAVSAIDDVQRVPQWIAISTYATNLPAKGVILTTAPVNAPGWSIAKDWSPNGRELAITRLVRFSGSRYIYRSYALTLETGTLRQLIPDVANPPDPDYVDWDVRWSPVK